MDNSFSTSNRVISSTRALDSGGSDASFGSRRASSDCRMSSNRRRNATTVGMAARERSHFIKRSTSSVTISSARSTCD
jgi:hypothetical protein